MKLFVVLSLASLALAAPIELDMKPVGMNFTEIEGIFMNFTTALVNGLQNPGVQSPCYLNTMTMVTQTGNIINDIETLIGGDFNGALKLILDSKPWFNAIGQETTVCNFTALYEDVAILLEPNGWETIVSRSTANMFSLLQDLNDLKTGDPAKVGQAIGDAFRRVFEWSL